MPANIMLPTNAKITALVCSGRRRPKVSHGRLKLAANSQLRGDEHADEHRHDAPENRREHELANWGVVVFDAGFGERLGAGG